VRVFGSVAHGTATEASDVDLLIDVPAGTGLIRVEQIADAVAEVTPWPVDVITSGAARRRMAHVLDEAVPLRPTTGAASPTPWPQSPTPT